MRFLDKILSENRLVSCVILTLQVVLLYVLVFGLISSMETNYLTRNEYKSIIIEQEYVHVECLSLESFGDGLVQEIEPTEPGVRYDKLSTEPKEPKIVGKLKTLKGTTRARREYRFEDDNEEKVKEKQREFEKTNETEKNSRIWA